MKTINQRNNPRIYNFYKDPEMTSYDVIRKFKKLLPRKSKLGHFGTLDPFACGVLMIGVHGAQRLNEYIHHYLPKTYVAYGILGQSTPTGDLTSEVDQTDHSDYLQEIAQFDIDFLQREISKKFIGEYWQAPHKYSAAKHEGKALHQWAREGVEIKKEKKQRQIYSLKVLDYSYPKLTIEFQVSSGTYIRTLFSDIAAYLGTYGVLEGLERTKIGVCSKDNTVAKNIDEIEAMSYFDMDEVLPFSSIVFSEKEAQLYANGVRLNKDRALELNQGEIDGDHYWVRDQEKNILGLAVIENKEVRSVANFNS